jgi:hypothetical protein
LEDARHRRSPFRPGFLLLRGRRSSTTILFRPSEQWAIKQVHPILARVRNDVSIGTAAYRKLIYGILLDHFQRTREPYRG